MGVRVLLVSSAIEGKVVGDDVGEGDGGEGVGDGEDGAEKVLCWLIVGLVARTRSLLRGGLVTVPSGSGTTWMIDPG